MDLAADHTEGFGAGVDVVKSRLDGLDVPAELLVDAVVRLWYCLVGVVDEAAAQARHPCPQESAAFARAIQAFTIIGHFRLERVLLRQDDVLGLSRKPFILILHFESL